jgi:putative sigma-54 modulation protein
VNLVIRGKNIEVPASARDYIAKKVERFGHLLKDITEIKVDLSAEKTRSKDDHYVVEMTLDCRGTFIRGEKRGSDILSAIDAAADMMDRQITRYKDRLQGRKPRLVMPQAEAAAEDAEEDAPIKVKSFPVKPMSPDEAIDQMELLGHDFFVFFNDASEQINVVYRRKSGNYGLIEPELD